MALLGSALKNLSIKWKISLALILSGLLFIGIYVGIAKSIFENDKISYVFDAQSSKLDSIKSDIESKLEKALLVSRSVIATFDETKGKVSPAGEAIFRSEKNLLGLELWNETKSQTLLRLEKQDSVLPPSGSQNSNPDFGALSVEPLNNHQLLLVMRYSQGDAGNFKLLALYEVKDLLPPANPSQSFALILNDKIIQVSDVRGLDSSIFSEMLTAFGNSDGADKTLIWSHGSEKYLVSEKALSLGKLRLISSTPEAEALGALGTLFKRSLIFIVFSSFGLIFISLMLSKSMTGGLHLLTEAAGEIGRGNFDQTPNIPSTDEIGILSRAFHRMAEEIKQLLVETKQKARMEEELKTASLIQERLLPHQANAQFGSIEVSGSMRTSSECGGDWWYYFKQEQNLYIAIADATGHGTPAALITAAARSVFSRIEHERLTLAEMINAWDQAIFSCSQKQVLMTGILIRIDTNTGKGAFISAAHESAFLLKETEDFSFEYETLEYPTSPRLGTQIQRLLPEVEFELKPNWSVMLYTDGLFAVEKPDGRVLSEKRFAKKLTGHAEHTPSAEGITQAVLKLFDEHREEQPLPDDISIVTIRRTGPLRSAFLENESGKMDYAIRS